MTDQSAPNERAQHGDRGANTREQDQERGAPREGEDGARRVKKGSVEAFLREFDAFSVYQTRQICQILHKERVIEAPVKRFMTATHQSRTYGLTSVRALNGVNRF